MWSFFRPDHLFKGAVHTKILMVLRQLLDKISLLILVDKEVLNNIKQSVLGTKAYGCGSPQPTLHCTYQAIFWNTLLRSTSLYLGSGRTSVSMIILT